MSVKIGVIVSTTREGRSGRNVAEWFVKQVSSNENANFEIIDLKEINLPMLSEKNLPSQENYELESTKKWSQTVKSYDGFVFITAEYNNGYPAPLKNALDTVYNEWDKKPVAFVGYGTFGAARAIEQLVNVTAKIGMVPLPKTVIGILNPWDSVKDGGVVDQNYVHGKLDGLVDNLLWWARVLASADK